MKNIIYLCVCLSLVLFICLNLPKANTENANNTSAEITVASKYTVKEYNGLIAIFTENESMPIQVFDTSVAQLPKSDRELLKLGIEVSTPDELQKIIEDYTG